MEVKPDATELLSNIDGFFTENLGQKGEGAGRFYCQGSPLSVAFGDGWVAYDLCPEGGDKGVMFRVSFEGSNEVSPVGQSPLKHESNFFIGNDPDEWITGARNYQEIVYPEIYNGIDLIYRLSESSMKYEFIVRPGGDPGEIVMDFDGVEGLSVRPDTGDLIIDTEVDSLVDSSPYTFQESPMGKDEVSCAFEVVEENRLTFEVADYDVTLPLVIDPELIFSTFIGTSAEDYGWGVDVDGDGDLYICGKTFSSTFPTTTGSYDTTGNSGEDMFVLKLETDGSDLVFSTFLGGSGPDKPRGFCCDVSGMTHIGGLTLSNDFPTTAGAFDTSKNGVGVWDSTVSILDSNGSRLLASTYYGGSGSDYGWRVHLDASGNVLMMGSTTSSDLPTTVNSYDKTYNGEEDFFFVKFNDDLSSLLGFTYIGGSGLERFYMDLTTDDDGYLYFTGETGSSDFPVTQGAYQVQSGGQRDAFVIKMDQNASRLIYSTFVGGSNSETGEAIHVDGEGHAFVAGTTTSGDFPTTVDAYDRSYNSSGDCFLIELNASGDSLIYGTYFGGNSDEAWVEMDRSDPDTFLLKFTTGSTDLPITPNGYDSTHNGNYDFYLCKLNISNKTVEYATYLGGSAWELFGAMVATEEGAVIVGLSNSTNYPTTHGAFDTSWGGRNDVVVTRILIEVLNGTAPSEPLNVTAERGDGCAHLEWDPPEYDGGLALRGYNIHRGTGEGDLAIVGIISARHRTYEDHIVSVGERYFYAVSAFNWKGESNLSSVVNVTVVGLPWPPQVFEAFPGDGNVTLTWQPPSNTGGLPLLGYVVSRGLDRYEMERIVEVDIQTSYLDEGLENGVEYFYAVRAINSLGEGHPTPDVVSAMPVGPPSEPRYMTAEAGDAVVTLEWRAPVSEGGRSIQGYRIFRGRSEDSVEPLTIVSDLMTTWTDTNLTNGVTYYYAVLAFNEIGVGELSPVVSATPIGLPGVPQDLKIKAGDGFVLLEWEPPAGTGGIPIERYVIFRGLSKTALVHHVEVEGMVTSYNDTGLENGVTLHYIIRADNGVHLGPNSTVISARPLTLPQPPRDVRADGEELSVILTWLTPENDGGAEIIHYRILRGTSTDSLEFLIDADPLYTKYDDFDIEPGTTYYYAISALTEVGEGPSNPTVQATPYGPPGPPMNARIEVGIKEVSIYWEPPEDDGASQITGYVIERGLSKDSLRKVADLGDVTSFLDTSVSYGQTYFYTIAAVNMAGVGERSPIISGTPKELLAAPGKVTTLVADAEGAKVTLQWSKPQDDGGSPVTGYVILRGLTKDALVQIAEVGPGVTTWSEDGLERGTTYYYSIAAKNNVGEGEPILAREVKVPPKEAESPGFEVVAVMAALMIVVPIVRRRVV